MYFDALPLGINDDIKDNSQPEDGTFKLLSVNYPFFFCWLILSITDSNQGKLIWLMVFKKYLFLIVVTVT